MSKNYALSAEKRDRAGKGVARALRREKKIPAVVYGDNKEPVLISLTEKEISKEYQRGHMYTHLCDLTIDGGKQLCIARDIQLHPVSDRIEHKEASHLGHFRVPCDVVTRFRHAFGELIEVGDA